MCRVLSQQRVLGIAGVWSLVSTKSSWYNWCVASCLNRDHNGIWTTVDDSYDVQTSHMFITVYWTVVGPVIIATHVWQLLALCLDVTNDSTEFQLQQFLNRLYQCGFTSWTTMTLDSSGSPSYYTNVNLSISVQLRQIKYNDDSFMETKVRRETCSRVTLRIGRNGTSLHGGVKINEIWGHCG